MKLIRYFSIACTLLLSQIILGQETIENEIQIINIEKPIDEIVEKEDKEIKMPVLPDTEAEGAIRFVSDEFYVPLRRTPCPDCTIVHRGLKSGTEIKLLITENNWGFVKIANGQVGWMEKQFIVESPSSKNQLEVSLEALKESEDRVRVLTEKTSELEENIINIKNKLLNNSLSENVSSNEAMNLLDISSESVALLSQNKELIQQNQELRNENDILKVELDVQKNDNRYKSFLFGGISVFLGALLSVLIPKLKVRKRLSEWG